MTTETFNGPRLSQQTHPGQGGALVGDLLNREERTAPVASDRIRQTNKAVRAWERGESRMAATAMGGIIELHAMGSLPKSVRKASALLGFRSEAGAARPLKIAQAAMQGVTPLITPLRRPTDAPKSIPAAIRYRGWAEAVAAQGVTACYNAAKAALTDGKALDTRREAFGKALSSRINVLFRLRSVGDVNLALDALIRGRTLSDMDCQALYTGPNPDAPMERGQTWDDILAEQLADEVDLDDEADEVA